MCGSCITPAESWTSHLRVMTSSPPTGAGGSGNLDPLMEIAKSSGEFRGPNAVPLGWPALMAAIRAHGSVDDRGATLADDATSDSDYATCSSGCSPSPSTCAFYSCYSWDRPPAAGPPPSSPPTSNGPSHRGDSPAPAPSPAPLRNLTCAPREEVASALTLELLSGADPLLGVNAAHWAAPAGSVHLRAVERLLDGPLAVLGEMRERFAFEVVEEMLFLSGGVCCRGCRDELLARVRSAFWGSPYGEDAAPARFVTAEGGRRCLVLEFDETDVAVALGLHEDYYYSSSPRDTKVPVRVELQTLALLLRIRDREWWPSVVRRWTALLEAPRLTHLRLRLWNLLHGAFGLADLAEGRSFGRWLELHAARLEAARREDDEVARGRVRVPSEGERWGQGRGGPSRCTCRVNCWMEFGQGKGWCCGEPIVDRTPWLEASRRHQQPNTTWSGCAHPPQPNMTGLLPGGAGALPAAREWAVVGAVMRDSTVPLFNVLAAKLTEADLRRDVLAAAADRVRGLFRTDGGAGPEVLLRSTAAQHLVGSWVPALEKGRGPLDGRGRRVSWFEAVDHHVLVTRPQIIFEVLGQLRSAVLQARLGLASKTVRSEWDFNFRRRGGPVGVPVSPPPLLPSSAPSAFGHPASSLFLTPDVPPCDCRRSKDREYSLPFLEMLNHSGWLDAGPLGAWRAEQDRFVHHLSWIEELLS